MRRRLWFDINILDVRSSEDRGSAPMIVPGSFDTKLPSNVNDADIGPLSFAEISDRVGCTEMTFNLITNEASVFARQWALPDHNQDAQDAHKNWYRIKAVTEELRQRLETKYMVHCDTSVPLYWVCKTVASLICLKLELLLQYPLQGRRLVPEVERNREASLKLAIALLVKTEAIDTDEHAAHFAWFLRTYVQWHPLAVVLAELCVDPGGPHVDQAWAAVNKMMDRVGDRIADSKKGTLWRPLKKLFAKAHAARTEYDKLHAERFPRAETLPAPTGLDNMGSLKLEDLPTPALSQDSVNMAMPMQDAAGLDYSTSFGAPPEMEFATNVDPMDLEGWDEFLKSTVTWDDPSMVQANNDLAWSMPFTMGSLLP